MWQRGAKPNWAPRCSPSGVRRLLPARQEQNQDKNQQAPSASLRGPGAPGCIGNGEISGRIEGRLELVANVAPGIRQLQARDEEFARLDLDALLELLAVTVVIGDPDRDAAVGLPEPGGAAPGYDGLVVTVLRRRGRKGLPWKGRLPNPPLRVVREAC